MSNLTNAEALDPSDAAQVDLAFQAAQANSSERVIDEAAQGYAVDPAVGAAITAGSSISVTGVNADQSVVSGTPQAVLAGSAQAAGVVAAYSLPIVGAGVPTQQTLAQLASRFDGIAGTPDSVFPTPQ